MYKISVPATSANLSVGFDTLGIAFDLYNEFYVDYADKFILEGFDEGYNKEDNNLFIKAYKSFFKKFGLEIIPISVKMVCNVPTSRGLGSSATLVVGGIFAASKITKLRLSNDEIFNLALAVEHHPDNVAPAIYGGLTSSYAKDGIFYAKQYDVNPDLNFLVLIPDYKIKTEDARKVLPSSLSYPDIVHNLSRIVMLPDAFKNGDVELLRDIFDDHLHEPYRANLIKEYQDFKKIALDNHGVLAISGSGSSMLVISKLDLEDLFDIKKLKLHISTGIEITQCE